MEHSNLGYKIWLWTLYLMSLTKKGFSALEMQRNSAIVKTDGKSCYKVLKDVCTVHEKVIVKDKKEVSSVLPWVHIAISNAKKKLSGLHHQVKDVYMQNYLNGNYSPRKVAISVSAAKTV